MGSNHVDGVWPLIGASAMVLTVVVVLQVHAWRARPSATIEDFGYDEPGRPTAVQALKITIRSPNAK